MIESCNYIFTESPTTPLPPAVPIVAQFSFRPESRFYTSGDDDLGDYIIMKSVGSASATLPAMMRGQLPNYGDLASAQDRLCKSYDGTLALSEHEASDEGGQR